MKKMGKIGYTEYSPGNKSISRLIAIIVILVAIIDSNILMFYFMSTSRTDMMVLATSVGAIFGAIATPALTYLFFVKKEESKNEKDEPQNPTT